MHAGDTIDDAADADRVVGPAPILAVDRHAAREGPVDVGEIPRLDRAVGPAGAGEDTDCLGDLLLQIETDAGPVGEIVAYQRGVGGRAGRLGKRVRVGKQSGAAVAEKACDLDLAGLTPKLVPFLDFAGDLT